MKKMLSLGVAFVLFAMTLSSCDSAPTTDDQNAGGTTENVTTTTTEVTFTDATTTVVTTTEATMEDTTTETNSTNAATVTTTTTTTTTAKKTDTTTAKKPVTTTTTTAPAITTTKKPTITTTTAATAKPFTEYKWVYNGVLQHGKIYKLSFSSESSGSLSWSGWQLLSEMNFADGYEPNPEDILIIHGNEYVSTKGSGGPCEVKIDGKTITIIDLSVSNEEGFVLKQIDEKTMEVVSSTIDGVPVGAIFVAEE